MVVEFEDGESASSSDMDEYESEDELGDMFCSPRGGQKHKKPVPAKTSKAKSQSTASKPQPSKPQLPKPPVASKPGLSAGAKFSSSAATAASTKPGRVAPAVEDVGNFLGLKEYMDAMDRELAKTTVGKSFVRDGDEVSVCD